ncbi:T9SS type A sorting domain-containing protein [Ichthyenterobacterium sp. W332]|uniref:T9SS type A sorting domain-containing protein n=1 Tax=Microcosmobacter mediterraneus TaxID=3075607 RepID=A0ABU2YKC1_9FLAO|nr:T9SS type A sorting domain-containing protein [Ichthyenterobacterium sp. W332]MDT0558621.1 T9SS type A sorting domain-containing protein [Ichthyenterobacterium sp. W332]
MKKLYFLCVALAVTSLSFGQALINEFQPNAAGTDPDPMPFELKGTPSASFSGWILSVESDPGGGTGTVDRATQVSGTFDANGLLVVNIPDLENPSFTVILCENFTGTAGTTDFDTDNDGVADDISTVTNVYDAIGIPDNTGDEALLYGAQLGGQDFTYTGDEPGLVFRDGVTNDWYALNEPFDGTSVYALDASTVMASDFSPAVALAGNFGTANPVYSAPTDPTITITSPSDGATFAPGTTSVDIDYTVLNPTGGTTIDITVNGTTTSDIMANPFTIMTMDGESYTVVIEMVDGGVLDSDTITFSVSGLEQVANVAALRAGTIGNTYELTGEVLITYLTSFRNQKHIEDTTGGILIDDNAGTITSPYALADGITGLVGTLGEFNNTLQFVPVEDPGTASSTGNTLTPQVVSFADLNANPENYESELVQVIAVDFDNTDTNFNNGLEIEMTQGLDIFNFRTAFNEDYSSGTIPTTASDVTGVILDRSGSYFLMARYASDFSFNVLSVESFETNAFSMYPNPTSTGFVNISSNNAEAFTAEVYDILGKQVKNQTVSNNRLDVSDLVSGIYIVKLTQNGASTTMKLVIR